MSFETDILGDRKARGFYVTDSVGFVSLGNAWMHLFQSKYHFNLQSLASYALQWVEHIYQ